MKQKKKILRLLFACMLLLSLTIAAACSKSDTEPAGSSEPTTTANKEQQGNASGENGGLTLPITDKPVTFKWMLSEKSDAAVRNDWPVAQAIKARTNVTIDFEPVPVSGLNEKKKILMATSSIPDIMQLNSNEARENGPDGVFLRLNDLIDKHAPNIKRVMEEYPETKVTNVASDGGIYSVPHIGEQNAFNFSFMARRDLMEQYGIKDPSTPEEFYEMLKTFKKHHPDSHPFSTRFFHLNWVSTIDEFVKMFTGIGGIQGYNPQTDRFEFAANHEGFQDAIVFLHKLYTEGLMDPEIAFIQLAQWEQKMLTGKSFVTFDYRTRADSMSKTALEANSTSTYNLTAIKPFAVQGQKYYTFESPVVRNDHNVALSPSISDPVTAIKLLDYFYTDEGSTLTQLGIEGKSYTVESGKYKLANAVDSVVLRRDYGAGNEGFSFFGKDKLVESQPLSKRIQQVVEMYEGHVIKGPRRYEESEKTIELVKQKGDNVFQYISEQLTKFIMDKEPINKETIARFIQKAKELGVEEIIDARNKDYAAQYGK